MSSLRNYFLVSLLLVGLGITTAARANSCETASPNVQFSKGIWAPVSTNSISHHVQARVFAYLARLVGTWKGAGKSTACVVIGDNTTPVKASEQLRLTVKSGGSADYQFNFSVFDTKNKVHTTYNFVIKQYDRHLQVEGEGNLSILVFYDGGMKFRTQTAMRTGFRRRFGAGTHNSLLSLETVRQLRLQDGKLIFNKAVFHNGTMIAFSDWMLDRD